MSEIQLNARASLSTSFNATRQSKRNGSSSLVPSNAEFGSGKHFSCDLVS